MKRSIVVILAAALFSASVPAMAMDHGEMAMGQGQMERQQHDEKCQKECDMLLKNCRTEVDSIQQRIEKLQTAINNHADGYTRNQLNKLKADLEDAQQTLASLEKAGGR